MLGGGTLNPAAFVLSAARRREANMSIRRQRKVSSLLRDEISQIIQQEMKDPRLGFVSVTRVDVSADISSARVFVSVFGSEQEQGDALEALVGGTGYIRRMLAPRLSMRTIPHLHFQLDQSMQHAENISRLLNELNNEVEQTASDGPDTKGSPD